jgi:hypothetical protein
MASRIGQKNLTSITFHVEPLPGLACARAHAARSSPHQVFPQELYPTNLQVRDEQVRAAVPLDQKLSASASPSCSDMSEVLKNGIGGGKPLDEKS